MSNNFETIAIHAGQAADPQTGAVVPPIVNASTFKQDGVGNLRGGFEYARSGNPTRQALETLLAAIESVELSQNEKRTTQAFAFASGLAAEDTLLHAVLSPTDHIVIPNDAYGGTYRLISKVLAKWGVTHTPAAVNDLAAIEAAIVPGKTKLIWIETPTNPLLNIGDIAAISEIAHRAGALVAVDNTFASPYLQQPLALGADVVIHSTTKYLGGHSDVIGGALIVKDPELAESIKFHQNAMGAIPGPNDCWLVIRGIKTLSVRMDRHVANAKQIVEFLSNHKRVAEVYYPGLETHPGHAIAAKQMKDFGGMVSFRHKDGELTALKMIERTKVFTLAESLGGVESLIEHPARMTHASVAGSVLEVPKDLIRLSVGIENIEDLLEDLSNALG